MKAENAGHDASWWVRLEKKRPARREGGPVVTVP
jgi:hypothetical protein